MPTAQQARRFANCPGLGSGQAKPGQAVWPPAGPCPSPRASQPDLSRTAKSFCCSSACTKTMRKCLLLSNEENRLIPSSMLGRQLSGICGSNRCCPQGSGASAWPRSQHLQCPEWLFECLLEWEAHHLFMTDVSYLPMIGNNGSVELKRGAQRRSRVPGGNPESPCLGPSCFPFSRQQWSGMSRKAQSSPLATWLGVSTSNTLNGVIP